MCFFINFPLKLTKKHGFYKDPGLSTFPIPAKVKHNPTHDDDDDAAADEFLISDFDDDCVFLLTLCEYGVATKRSDTSGLPEFLVEGTLIF